MNEEKEKPLQIPQNCSPISYIIEGFTSVELSEVGFAGLVALLIAGYIYIRHQKVLLALFILIFIIGGAIIFFRKDKYTENMLDKIRILMRNRKMRKKYIYVYVNIYEQIKNIKLAEIGTDRMEQLDGKTKKNGSK